MSKGELPEKPSLNSVLNSFDKQSHVVQPNKINGKLEDIIFDYAPKFKRVSYESDSDSTDRIHINKKLKEDWFLNPLGPEEFQERDLDTIEETAVQNTSSDEIKVQRKEIAKNIIPKDFMDYFDEITSMSKIEARSELVQSACPVPLDFFKNFESDKLSQLVIYPDDILEEHISKEYRLTRDDLAVNLDNIGEVQTFLRTGQPLKIKTNSIRSGIIAASVNTRNTANKGSFGYLVLIGSPNKKGHPGRLFIIHSKRGGDHLGESDMEEGEERFKARPHDYVKTMKSIENYEKSFMEQTIEESSDLLQNFVLLRR